MDLYLISRMFRSYSNEKLTNTKDAENIIIYAGAYHTLNYMTLLLDLGFDITYDIHEDFDKCIRSSEGLPILFTKL